VTKPADNPWAMPEGCDPPGRLQGICVGHRIEIDAPPELVWDFIADFQGWDAWNPLYIRTRGRAIEGEKLNFTVSLEGMKPRAGSAQVTCVRPGELLEYQVSTMAGLVKAQRFVAVEELSPTRCAVANGEIMAGPVGKLIARSVGSKVGKGLEGMNRALRQIAERKWSAQPRG